MTTTQGPSKSPVPAPLQRTDRFVQTAQPLPLGLPRRQVVLLAYQDHRIDPAAVFGLSPETRP